MDAFVQRSPRHLFRRARFVLWPCAVTDGDAAAAPPNGSAAVANAALTALIVDHGGQVVDGEADADAALSVVLADAAGATAADGALDQQQQLLQLPQIRLRFPTATVVTAQWVRDCAAQKKRLPVRGYEVVEALDAHATSRQLASGDTAVEPPKKRAKPSTTGFFEPATHVVASSGAEPEKPATGETRRPHFRPWQSLDGGSLLVLDARPQVEALSAQARAVTASGASNSVKIAAFDLDGTLIVTKSGKRFAKDDSDWQWFHPSRVPGKLAELLADEYLLVLFSNQNGIEKGKVAAAEVQRKVTTIIKKLNLPMVVFLATRDDLNRKPRVKAWESMLQLLRDGGNADLAVNLDESFYCGDAAGRPKIAGRAKDFAATDYKFALNLGIPFHTPEALFLSSKQRIHTHPDTWEIGFDPRSISVREISTGFSAATQAAAQERDQQEMIVLVGSPASGKSWLAASCFPSYAVISQDELRTLANCRKACLDALSQKKSVVVDGTNRTVQARKDWITLAQSQNLPVRCFEMDAPKPLSMHLNVFRSLTTTKKIPDVAIHGFYKNFSAPQIAEGFESVVKIQFRVDLPKLADEMRRLIRSFL